MSDAKIALALERQLLGPGRFMRHCGCVGRVVLYYPKRPWVYVDSPISSCRAAGLIVEAHLSPGWYAKETRDRVDPEQLKAAWDALHGCDGYVVIKRGSFKYLVASDGDLGLGPSITLVAEKPKTTWPPKMAELFKKS